MPHSERNALISVVQVLKTVCVGGRAKLWVSAVCIPEGALSEHVLSGQGCHIV